MNISFIVNNLGNSELTFDLISTVNAHPEHSNAIFYQNILPPVIEPQCLATNLTSLNAITGTAIAFDLESAQALDASGTPTKNVLYLYDLEWFYKPINFLVAKNLMSRFKIYTVNDKYASILANYLNEPVSVCETMEKLYKCLTTE